MAHKILFEGVTYKAVVDNRCNCVMCDLRDKDCRPIEDLKCRDDSDVIYKKVGEEHARK
jgi:hypothetical protein